MNDVLEELRFLSGLLIDAFFGSVNWKSPLSAVCGPEKFKSGFPRVQDYFSHYQEVFKKKEKLLPWGGPTARGRPAFYLESLLLKEGLATGLWTSPSCCGFYGADSHQWTEVLPVILWRNPFIGSRVIGTLSYYEFMFALFCEEVREGPGGFYHSGGWAWGAVLMRSMSLMRMSRAITSISRDHRAILGETIWGDTCPKSSGLPGAGKASCQFSGEFLSCVRPCQDSWPRRKKGSLVMTFLNWEASGLKEDQFSFTKPVIGQRVLKETALEGLCQNPRYHRAD